MRRALYYLFLDLLWLAGAVWIYGVPVALAVGAGRPFVQALPGVWGWAAAVLASYPVFLVALILVVGLFRVLFPRMRTGVFSMRSKEAFFFYLQHGLKCYITSTFLIRQINHLSLLRTLYYRAMGCRYSPSAFVGLDSELHDPSLTEVGDRAFIGEGVHVYGHMVIDGKLHLGRVRIGARTLVGAETLVGPDTVIGDGAQVAACSAVAAGSRIGPGELWLGIPAKRVKRLGPKEDFRR